MSTIIDLLREEHDRIQLVLENLGKWCAHAHLSEIRPTRDQIAALVRYFSEFIDNIHHGKEEHLLFRTMCEHGFSRDQGPIGVMLYEHGEGRAHIEALARLASQQTSLSDEDVGNFFQHAHAYINLMRQHIYKENNILYPMAQKILPSDVMETITQQSGEFQKQHHTLIQEIEILEGQLNEDT